MKIIKFGLSEEANPNKLIVPDDFTPISAHMQNGGGIAIWGETYFESPRDAPQRTMYVFTIGTGWEVKRDRAASYFLGTVIDGVYVWHFYWSWIDGAITLPS